MNKEKKVEKALVPYFGEKHPEKALKKALERLQKGGKLYLLHIIDDASTRSIRYRAGQIGENSEIVKTLKETQEKIRAKDAEEYSEEVKKEAAKHGISVEPLYVSGDPAQEVLEAIDEYSIDLVLVERLREKLAQIFLGDEIEYLCEEATCEVLPVSE